VRGRDTLQQIFHVLFLGSTAVSTPEPARALLYVHPPQKHQTVFKSA